MGYLRAGHSGFTARLFLRYSDVFKASIVIFYFATAFCMEAEQIIMYAAWLSIAACIAL